MTGIKGFIIDLSRCTGCYACAVACRDRANLPEGTNWLTIALEERGAYPDVTLTYRPAHCWHCEQPACLPACPVKAISRDGQGLVQIDAEMCVGCGACIEACPFGAVVMGLDAATKCDGCADEVASGLRPTCVRACPTRALEYGPIEEPMPSNQKPDTAFDDHGIGPSVQYRVKR